MPLDPTRGASVMWQTGPSAQSNSLLSAHLHLYKVLPSSLHLICYMLIKEKDKNSLFLKSCSENLFQS